MKTSRRVGKENAVTSAAALAAKSGKSNDNAKDQSFQIVRLNDQIAALKRQLTDQQTANEENAVLLTKNSEVMRSYFVEHRGILIVCGVVSTVVGNSLFMCVERREKLVVFVFFDRYEFQTAQLLLFSLACS